MGSLRGLHLVAGETRDWMAGVGGWAANLPLGLEKSCNLPSPGSGLVPHALPSSCLESYPHGSNNGREQGLSEQLLSRQWGWPDVTLAPGS